MIKNGDMIKFVEAEGAHAKGRTEYIKFLKGQPLTFKQAVLAHCYDCTNMEMGRGYCKVDSCPISLYHHYNPNKIRNKQPMTEENKKKASERMKKVRAKK